MEALVGPFIEGWALGKYSGKLEEKSTQAHTEYGYLKYGKLVHDYKYDSFKGIESSGKSMRKSIMLEINATILTMPWGIQILFPPSYFQTLSE